MGRRRGALALAFLLLAGTACAREPNRPVLSGERALRHVRELVQWGNRAPGSSGHAWAQAYIIRQLRLAYVDEIGEVDFVAQTPRGMTPMKNIIAKFPGKSSEVVVLAGHYDTLAKEGFVGANDAGSSTALLLELARVVGLKQPPPVTIWIAFFDGEEAFEKWSERDGLYGSRYQASVWQRQGALERIKAVIVVDMVGDKDLRLRRDLNSTPWLTDLIWKIAADKGYSDHFSDAETAVLDDHVPFRQAGVPAVDLIDFEYGPGNQYWHTSEDSVDKLSARSFKIVGEVVLEAVARLGQRWPSAGDPPP